MGKLSAKAKEVLHRHPALRKGIREARWQMKRVPGLSQISIAIDRAYFKDSGHERPDADVHGGADEYSEAYANFIVLHAHGAVLDIGCGHGYLTYRIAENPAVTSVIGIDKVENFERTHPKITFMTQDLPPTEDFPGTFDVAVASEFIEHITEEDHRKILTKVVRALVPGGAYIGSTPQNPTRFKTFSGSRFHLREYNEEDLRNILHEFFRDVTITALPVHCLAWEAKGPRQ